MTAVDVALDARAHLGEGPTWSAADGRLLWVDITAGEVHRFDPVTAADEVLQVGEDVGAVVPTDRPGTLGVAVRRGLGLLDTSTGATALVADLHSGNDGIRMNDGKCDPAGRLLAGSMRYDFAAGGAALYRLEPGGDVTTLLDGLAVSNGLAWSADGRTLFFIDTPTRRVDRFDYGDALTGRTVAVDLSAEEGMPDGMTIDSEGLLWVAMFGGSAVLRCSPDGEVVERVSLPCSQPTSCAFGGADLGTLFITTARYGFDDAQLADEPLAGALLACRPGMTGTAAVPLSLT